MLICLDQRTESGCGAENRSDAQNCNQCGRSLRYALQLHDEGTMIEGYHIIGIIGRGAFGAVYLAQELGQAGHRVALKEAFDPESIRRFESEFAVLQRLQHDNLPRYHRVFEMHGNGYLVMEFVPGQNLEEVLSRQSSPLAESQVLSYAVQLCDVLDYLHRQNPPIIHRDIKPANIRLTPDGLIKLVDFGIYKQGTSATVSSRRALTPAYAPIEQYGGGRPTGPRSDVYSLGATLYHLLANHEPTDVTQRIAASQDTLVPLRDLSPRVSQRVATAVMTAMAITQEQRYPSVHSFKQALFDANMVEHGADTIRTVGWGLPAPTDASAHIQTLPQEHSRVALRNPLAGRKDPVPSEIVGLCWGGFFLSFIWSLAHRLWLPAILMFVPYLNVIVLFLLLFKGNEWAWRKGHWRDVAHFKATQRSWTIASIVLLLIPLVLCALLAVVFSSAVARLLS